MFLVSEGQGIKVSGFYTGDGSGSIFCCLSWVGCSGSSLVMVWAWKISPKNPNFFPLGTKKIASGWVKKYPDQSRVGPLFTAGQKYARVGSGPITTSNISE